MIVAPPGPDPSPVPTPAGGGPGRTPRDRTTKDPIFGKRKPKDPKPPLDPEGDDDGDGGPDGAQRPRRYGFDKEEVRRRIEAHFRVYEERDALPGLEQSILVAFFILGDREAVDRNLPVLQKDLQELDPQIQVVLREEGGETALVVTRRPETEFVPRSRLPAVLAAITTVMLTLAGAIAWLPYEGSVEIRRIIEPRYLAFGFLYYTLPLLFVFAVQEGARRLAARRHGLRLGGSFWVPVPPFVFIPSIGTFGSISNPREPYADRRALFDVAAAGPIAGFFAAIPVLFVGFLLTVSAAVPVPDGGDIRLELTAPDGSSWVEGEGDFLQRFERTRDPEDPNRAHNVTVSFSLLVAGRGYGQEGWNLTARGTGETGAALDAMLNATALDADGAVLVRVEERGEVEPGAALHLVFDVPNGTERLDVVLEFHVPDRTTLPVGEPLAFQAVEALMPADGDYILHPMGFAGWTALLVIGITLVPAGRLDGGALARALLGDRMVWVSYAAIAALAILSFFYVGWVYLVLFILLFFGARHPAPLNDTTKLDRKRYLIALLIVLLLVVCFVPVPADVPRVGLF